MKVFIRAHRLLPLATFILLAALVAVALVSPLVQVQWRGTNGVRLTLGRLGGYALASGTWTAQTPPSGITQNLNGIACPSASTCFAVGASGTILVTTNGSTWGQLTSGIPKNSLSGIACPGTSTCFVVGESGTILKTTDGSTWSSQSGGTNNSLNGIACPGISTCFVVGTGGTILNTIDGSSWTGQTSGTKNSLNGIACPSTTTCFAVGANGTILSNAGGSLGGSLSESVPTSTSAAPVTLNGKDQTTTYALAVTVVDTTGSGAGWNLTIKSTQFTAGSHTLSTSASSIKTAPTPACVGSCTPPTNSVSYSSPLVLSTTAQKFFNAAVNSGMGTMTITATVTVAIPANTYAGSYTSTLTLAIVSGP